MKRDKPAIFRLFSYLFQRETAYIIVLCAIFAAVVSILTLIPTQSSETELQTVRTSNSISTIIENPLHGPYKLLAYTSTTLVPSIRSVRAVSFVFLILTSIALFYALKHWHTVQTSLITSFAFATNAVVLAVARYGTPLITLMGFFMFASLLLWQLHSKSNKALPIVVIVAGGLLLYTPGAPWFALILGIVYWDRVKPFIKNIKRQAILVGILLALIALSPLLWRFSEILMLLDNGYYYLLSWNYRVYGETFCVFLLDSYIECRLIHTSTSHDYRSLT